MFGKEQSPEIGAKTQFSSEYQPENRGRKPSIVKQIIKMIDSDGVMTFKRENVVSIDDKEVKIKVPTQRAIAFKLLETAMNSDDSNSLKAMNMLLDRIDGKPGQKLEINSTVEHNLNMNIPMATWAIYDGLIRELPEFFEFLISKGFSIDMHKFLSVLTPVGINAEEEEEEI